MTLARGESRHPWRNLSIAAGVLVLVGIIAYLGWTIRANEPDFYRPGRRAVVDARQLLAESYGHQAAVIDQLNLVHRTLDNALEALQEAEIADPADRAALERLTARLRSLEDPRALVRMPLDELKTSYHELSGDLEALIRRLEQPAL